MLRYGRVDRYVRVGVGSLPISEYDFYAFCMYARCDRLILIMVNMVIVIIQIYMPYICSHHSNDSEQFIDGLS